MAAKVLLVSSFRAIYEARCSAAVISLRQQNPYFLLEMHYKSLHIINILAVAHHKRVAVGKCFFLQLHLQREHKG